MPVSVTEAREVDLDLVSAFARLVPQLSRSAAPPDADQLASIVASPCTTVFVARDDETGVIVGTLTLVIFRIPTGVRAIIEDVVVDASVRGRGLRTGEALTAAAVEASRAAGVRTVDLTSRPAREDANRLYVRLGFEQRDTNVYRLDLAAS